MADRSVEARIANAKIRQEQLTAEEQRLLERLQEVRAALSKCDEELRFAERASTPRRNGVAEETWRRTVRELGTFTVSELATKLGCSKATAKKHLDVMATHVPPLVKPVGRILGKPAYEYVKPDDAGEAFKGQQRFRSSVQPPEVTALAMADLAPDRSAQVRQSNIGSVSDKELRQVVREAISRGWRLHHTGKSGHSLRLVKGSVSITVPSTPRNSGDAAQMLRQQLFGTSSRQVAAGTRG